MPDTTATKASELCEELVGTGFPEFSTDLSGGDYALPSKDNNPLYDDLAKLSLNDLTTQEPNGTGSFDSIMTSVKSHLQEEFEENRITGEEYSKAYIELTTAALSTGLQFLLQRDSNYIQNQLIQQQARAAEVQLTSAAAGLEEAKLRVKLAQMEGENVKVQYALSKLQLATEDLNYDLTEKRIAQATTDVALSDYRLNEVLPEEKRQLVYQTDFVLPKQVETSTAQIANMVKTGLDIDAGRVIKDYQRTHILPEELSNLSKDVEAKTASITKVNYEVDCILPAQKVNLERDGLIKSYQLSNTLVQQYALLKEQTEVQRGQTQDTRLDGVTNIVGAIGKQKELYSQQIDSYKKDARYKVAKMWLDQWITQKSLDEGLFAPDQFSNSNFNAVLSNLREDNALGVADGSSSVGDTSSVSEPASGTFVGTTTNSDIEDINSDNELYDNLLDELQDN